MKRSSERILTTHTGSLPRPADLVEMIQARENGETSNDSAFYARVKTAVAEIVAKQIEVGVDIVSDGEMGKPSFASYVKDRITGFSGENPEPRVFTDRAEFPEWNASYTPNSPALFVRPMCTGPLSWTDKAAVQVDIDNFHAALDGADNEDAFIPSASLGIISEIMNNRHYPSEEAYLYALADVMKEEYQAIAQAGLVLQIDAPDAAMGRHSQFGFQTLAEFRAALAQRIEALNHALEGIPQEQIRFHLCWGNYEGPHHHDVPLRDIVDLVLQVNAGAYSLEAANPRHEHEWRVWKDIKLPDGKVLIPGVIDTTTHFIEHPELVAQRIVRIAQLVGKDNVIAGTDCGFSTSAGAPRVDTDIMWAKFRTLAEGAKLATTELWGRP